MTSHCLGLWVFSCQSSPQATDSLVSFKLYSLQHSALFNLLYGEAQTLTWYVWYFPESPQLPPLATSQLFSLCKTYQVFEVHLNSLHESFPHWIRWHVSVLWSSTVLCHSLAQFITAYLWQWGINYLLFTKL